jgi:anti-sigma regulatory factor (Ser/Thr protein kinase)
MTMDSREKMFEPGFDGSVNKIEANSAPIHWREEIPANSNNANQHAQELEHMLAGFGSAWSEDDIFELSVGYLEALVNAMKYGNKDNSHTTVSVSIDIDAKHVEISITDRNPVPFDPNKAFNAVTDPSEILAGHGRGIVMMQAYYPDGMHYKFLNPGNKVTLFRQNKTEK